MADMHELIAARKKKLSELQKAGIDPYPEKTPPHTAVADVLRTFGALKRSKKRVTIAGRIKSLRPHGGATFIDIADESGTLQVLAQKKQLKEKKYKVIGLLDQGDIVAISGTAMVTKRGEKSLQASNIVLLTKSMRPLPDSWYGLKDVEERYRQRSVDLLLNPEVVQRFLVRSRLLSALRNTLEEENFLEVETPILQAVPGGAAARPFVTNLHALDLKLYLRVAPELYLKRLLVGGMERVYELGRAFRNEGMDRTHNPEFTILEFYWAYQNLDGLMQFTEKLLRKTVRFATGSTTATYGEQKMNFAKKFPRIEFSDAFKKYVGVPHTSDLEVLIEAAKEHGVPTKDVTRAALIDHLFKKVAARSIPNLCFVIHHPIELSPLAKAKPGSSQLVRRMQVYASGFELVNAYAELNDPVEQRARFMDEKAKERAGDEEAQAADEEFLTALEYGMPPAAGFGLGVDRFTMLVTDARSIKEVILFPTLRPKR